MPDRSRKRPGDPNQLGKLIVDLATGEAVEAPSGSEDKNAAAVELGRLGGLRGGRARAAKLSAGRTLRGGQESRSGAVGQAPLPRLTLRKDQSKLIFCLTAQA